MSHSITSQSSNSEIADTFRTIGEILAAQGENIFRTRAYARAADSIGHLEQPLKDIWERGEVDDIPGIGKGFVGLINELFTVGFIAEFDTVIGSIPAGAFQLMKLSGVGVKKALRLADLYKLDKAETAFEIMKKHIENGDLQSLEGFGKKSADQLLDAIESYRGDAPTRFVLPMGGRVSQAVIEHLKKIPECIDAETLGSSRRKSPTVGDIDIAVKTNSPDKIMELVKTFPGIHRLLALGANTARFIDASGIQVDVKTHQPEGWGNMLQHYTGSKQHNIVLRSIVQKKGWSLSEKGLQKEKENILYDTEKELYNALGMDYIPPEMREDRGEVDAALKKQLPQLIEPEDIKGDIHMHTNLDFPTSHDMGESSIAELLNRSVELGYEYLGFSDHNPKSSALNAKERLEAVKKRNDDIDKAVGKWQMASGKKMKVFKGLEVDIRPDGTLALEDESLDVLDYAIASIHAQLRQPKDEMTERVLKALAHPKVRVWGHPSARVLMERDGIDCDWEKIFAFCAENNKIIEINSAPSRLDLADTLIPVALEHGVKFIINTDTHHVDNMSLMPYGVSQARRGWLEAKNVVNTFSLKEFEKILKS